MKIKWKYIHPIVKRLLKLFAKGNVYYIIYRISVITIRTIKLTKMSSDWISKDLTKKASKGADKLIRFDESKSRVLRFVEAFDDDLFYLGFNISFNKLGDKIPEKFRTDVIEFLECLANEDIDGMVTNIGDIINIILDIPYLDEELEENLIMGVLVATLKKLRSLKKDSDPVE